jgi:ABC-type cobalt transport system substrate-binding protein
LLARLLDQLKGGFGFWALIALFAAYGQGTTLLNEIDFIRSGAMSRNQFVVSLFFLVIVIVSAVLLMRKKSEAEGFSAQHVFAIFLLASTAGQIFTPLYFPFVEPLMPELDALLPAFAKELGVSILFVLTDIVCIAIAAAVLKHRSRSFTAMIEIILLAAIILAAGEINRLIGGLFWYQTAPLFWAIVAWVAWGLVRSLPLNANPAEEDLTFDDQFKRGWRN